MEDMAWQYPAENVERAAVRFCEAVAKWRGKPELETVSPLFFLIAPPPPIALSSLVLYLYWWESEVVSHDDLLFSRLHLPSFVSLFFFFSFFIDPSL
jgi:hypothetical protein